MNRASLPGSPVLAIALLCAVVHTSCSSFKQIDKTANTNPLERVSVTLPVNIATTRKALLELPRTPHSSEEILPGFPSLDLFLVAPRGDPIFPDDGSIRVNLDRAPWMTTYLSLPEEERTQDLYLYAVTDLFWPSDYVYKGEPTKFYSDFIIHFETAGDASTQVEVFEFLPRIWVGRSFQLGAHGPCMCRDQRWVGQTKGDRAALLRAIQALVDD